MCSLATRQAAREAAEGVERSAAREQRRRDSNNAEQQQHLAGESSVFLGAEAEPEGGNDLERGMVGQHGESEQAGGVGESSQRLRRSGSSSTLARQQQYLGESLGSSVTAGLHRLAVTVLEGTSAGGWSGVGRRYIDVRSS